MHQAMPDTVAATLAALRARRPLVHCLTSPVAANFTANALLCLGAAPVMAVAPGEVAGVARAADALLINLGMATPGSLEAAHIAAAGAREAGRPWVLDPVAAGAIPARTATAHALAARGPSVIKGNASEVMAMGDDAVAGRGTDAMHDAADAVEPARRLSRSTGAVVAITAAVDRVTDGERVISVHHGHLLMAQVSGMGCVAGAVVAACLAVEPDALAAAEQALLIMGLAGHRAAASARGPGSFVPAFLDALHGLAPAPVPPSLPLSLSPSPSGRGSG